jgi:hypothetical protein
MDMFRIESKSRQLLYEGKHETLREAVEAAAAADKLENANLAHANLEGAKLVGANLEGANLTRADLRDANLSGVDLSSADLEGANLWGAYLKGANLEGANLAGAGLSAANLSAANLAGADLEGADLFDANLRGAKLAGANLEGAYLEDADLQGARGAKKVSESVKPQRSEEKHNVRNYLVGVYGDVEPELRGGPYVDFEEMAREGRNLIAEEDLGGGSIYWLEVWVDADGLPNVDIGAFGCESDD